MQLSSSLPSGANETQMIPVEGAELFCSTMGRGNPLIVVHGGPGLGHNYLLPHLSALAKEHFLIFYDQRGCGRSTGVLNEETVNIPTFIKDLESIRNAFQLEKTSLLGHSWGGRLIAEYALAYPNRVEKLILSNTVPLSTEELTLFGQEFANKTNPFREALSKIENTPQFAEGNGKLYSNWLEIIYRTYCHYPDHVAQLNYQMDDAAALKCMQSSQFFGITTLSKPHNLHEALKQLPHPTLLIHGAKDVVPPKAVQTLQKSFPNASYVELNQCGHFPFVDQPEGYFRNILDFLKSHS